MIVNQDHLDLVYGRLDLGMRSCIISYTIVYHDHLEDELHPRM